MSCHKFIVVITGRENCFHDARSSHQRCSIIKGVLRNFRKFTGKHLCQSLFFKKEPLAQVFSCKFCKICKNSFMSQANYFWIAYILGLSWFCEIWALCVSWSLMTTLHTIIILINTPSNQCPPPFTGQKLN